MPQKVRINESVFIAMPSYDGWYGGGCVSGVYQRGTRKFMTHPEMYNSSLLPKTFNVLWVRAISSNCRYWAMIHADINPPTLWIDSLIGEMQRRGCTFLSSAIAIKNERKTVSCAMCHPSDDEPHHILTEDDLSKLPATFTGYDVTQAIGVEGELVANTGLWVADLSADWVKQVWFELTSGIVWDGNNVHIKQTSEDWNLSKMLHRLGITVTVTQKLAVGHCGQKEWVCGGKG